MSTRRTVEVFVSCSVRKTSKSGRREVTPGSPRASRSSGLFSGPRRAFSIVPRMSRWNGSPNSYGFVVSSRSPPRPDRSIRWPPKASRDRRANRSSRTFWPIRRLPRGVSSSRSPFREEIAGLLELAGELVERLQVAGAVGTEQLADLVAVQVGEVRRRFDHPELVLQPVERLELADPLERRLQAERLLATELVSPRRARRASARSMFEASRARSQRSRSSRSNASIIDSSSARCCGVIDRRSEAIAAIRSVSCSTMSSSDRRQGRTGRACEEVVDLILASARDPRGAAQSSVEVRGPSRDSASRSRCRALDRLRQAVDEPVERLLAGAARSAR
jgi:hypothetical protein